MWEQRPPLSSVKSLVTIRSSAPVDLFREADLSWCPSAHSCSCSLMSTAVLIESLLLAYCVIQDISKNEEGCISLQPQKQTNKTKLYQYVSDEV